MQKTSEYYFDLKMENVLDRLSPLSAIGDNFDGDVDEENVDDEDSVDFPRETVKRVAEP